MTRATRGPRRAPWRHAILASCLAGGAILGNWTIDRVVAQSRETAEQNALHVAQAAVEAVRQRAERTLEMALTLHVVGRRIQIDRMAAPDAAPQLLERYLVEAIRAGRLDALQLAIIDATGMLVWSTSPGFVPIDLSDREHFRVHRDGRREPFISAPLIGRVSGRPSVQVTQALVDDAGDFIGVAVVSMDPIAISNDLRVLDFGPGALATVLRRDGTILARSMDATTRIGSVATEERTAMLDSAFAGTGRWRSEIDGRERNFAWRHIRPWSLVVTFGLDYEPIEAAARRLQRLLTAVLLSLLASGAIGALFVFAWQDRNRSIAAARLAEIAAREAAELLQAIPGATYRGTITADGRYQGLAANSGTKTVEGWPAEAMPDFPGDDSTEPAVTSRMAFFRDVFARAEAIREFRIRSTTGAWVWVREHCRIARPAPPGESTEVVGLIIDITEERQIKAQAIASAKLATLGEMATGVAHELNQPCASIALAADVAMLELDRGTPQDLASARQRLDDIAEQTTRMREVIDHFQIFSRVADGRAGATSLPDAVAGALKICTGMLKAAGITVTIDLPADLPLVHGELVPLEQVLVNLFVNARDAMTGDRASPKRIEVAARHNAAAGEVAMTVRDHGHGLPGASVDRLFEPFFTTKPPGQGTGLGLAIAYGTLRGFGGAIDIGNHAEGGAIVTLRLKVQENTLPDHGSPMPVAAPADS